MNKDKKDSLTKKRLKIVRLKNKPHKDKESYISNTGDNIIELKNVWKYYTNGFNCFKALENINLNIKKGSFVVILGKSGSGKSSLMNIMSGLIRASDGETIVNGKNLITFNNKELTDFRAHNCGFIFQQYGLLSTLTVEENIFVGQNLKMKIDKQNKKDVDSIHKVMQTIGIYELKDKYPSQLSGGQQQRVSIARAVAKKPLILFGDEPTGAVDSAMTYNILKLLKDVNKEDNITVVLITHDERLLEIADHVVHIQDGKIIKNVKQTPLKDFKSIFI